MTPGMHTYGIPWAASDTARRENEFSNADSASGSSLPPSPPKEANALRGALSFPTLQTLPAVRALWAAGLLTGCWSRAEPEPPSPSSRASKPELRGPCRPRPPRPRALPLPPPSSESCSSMAAVEEVAARACRAASLAARFAARDSLLPPSSPVAPRARVGNQSATSRFGKRMECPARALRAGLP
jgi:hypothetical protein